MAQNAQERTREVTIRRAKNGWLVHADAPEQCTTTASILVFETVGTLLDWVMENLEGADE